MSRLASASIVPLAFALFSTLIMPGIVGLMCLRAKYRKGLVWRLGLGYWRTSKARESCLWVHAASVGEIVGIEPLLSGLKGDDSARRLVISTTSLTGLERARKLVGDENASLLPLDTPLCIWLTLRRIRPETIIISETEIWPNLLWMAKLFDIPVVIINGRISDYSWPRYRRLSGVLKLFLGSLRYCLVQTSRDAERFVVLGVEAQNVKAVGCSKFDKLGMEISPSSCELFAEDLGIDLNRPCLVLGSVRPKEDKIMLEAWQWVREKGFDLQLIVAPRHQECFGDVAKLMSGMGIDFVQRSQKVKVGASGVVLLDTLGELVYAYAISSVAFVGATLVDIGGHNPLEPARFGLPVLVGPYHSNVRDIVQDLASEGALFVVHSSEEAGKVLVDLVSDAKLSGELGEKAKAVWQKNIGATERILESLGELGVL